MTATAEDIELYRDLLDAVHSYMRGRLPAELQGAFASYHEKVRGVAEVLEQQELCELAKIRRDQVEERARQLSAQHLQDYSLTELENEITRRYKGVDLSVLVDLGRIGRAELEAQIRRLDEREKRNPWARELFRKVSE